MGRSSTSFGNAQAAHAPSKTAIGSKRDMHTTILRAPLARIILCSLLAVARLEPLKLKRDCAAPGVTTSGCAQPTGCPGLAPRWCAQGDYAGRAALVSGTSSRTRAPRRSSRPLGTTPPRTGRCCRTLRCVRRAPRASTCPCRIVGAADAGGSGSCPPATKQNKSRALLLPPSDAICPGAESQCQRDGDTLPCVPL